MDIYSSLWINVAQMLYQILRWHVFSSVFASNPFKFVIEGELNALLGRDTSSLMIQCVAGTLAGFTTTLITNPMDTIRARLQVCFLSTFFITEFNIYIYQK